MVNFHSHAIHKGQVEVAEFAVGIGAEVVVAGSLDGAAALACEDDGELGGVVGVAVPEAAGEEDHAVFQQGPLAFVGGLHFGRELAPEFNLVLVDALIHFQPMVVSRMVGKFVDAAADAVQAGETHVRQVVIHHERGHAGAIHLEGQQHDVKHEAQVRFAALGNASSGSADGWCGDGRMPALTVRFRQADFLLLREALFAARNLRAWVGVTSEIRDPNLDFLSDWRIVGISNSRIANFTEFC